MDLLRSVSIGERGKPVNLIDGILGFRSLSEIRRERGNRGSTTLITLVALVALAHYQFETLHPFSDGNGRIGGLVAVLQFVKAGVLSQPLLTLSPWLERRRKDYQDQLLAASQTGDFDDWIRFFSLAVREQSDSNADRVDQLITIHAQMRDLVRESGARGTIRDIAEGLIGTPVLTPTFAPRVYDKSYTAANNAIQRLVELGILTEVTGGVCDRVFVANEVFRILET